jgi:hypothetical protein
MKMLKAIVLVLFTIIVFSNCKKNEMATYAPNTYNAYFPLQVGHVLTYQLDSTVTTNFETALVTRSYLLQDSIAGFFMDNNNDTSYTVYRSITDLAGTQPWKPLSTYTVTPYPNKVEVNEDNNLRYIKLVTPVADGHTWSGNTYTDIPANQMVGGLLYPNNMSTWKYTYQNTNQSYNTGQATYENSVAVFQNADSTGIFDPSIYFQKSIATEVYAKDIGLIYKKFYFVIWQPQGSNWNPGSFGIELKLVSYK